MQRQCFVWLPHSYSGRGPAESCVRIIEHFEEAGLETTLFIGRARADIPASVNVVEGLIALLRLVPYALVADTAKRRLERKFRAALEQAPKGSIAYFWPDAPINLVRYAKAQGHVCVREFINSPLAHAKPLLDAAYRDAGFQPAHGITAADVASETAELLEYDLCFSSNAEVDAALAHAGVAESRILKSTFGWSKTRFETLGPLKPQREDGPCRALFVGLVNTRKGIPTLLEAWEQAGVDGELILAGEVEPGLQPLVEKHCASGRVRHLGHVSDVSVLYGSCGLFVFPTHEEGGPQVTYEAAVCGAPIVTTAMGAARLVEHGISGMLCEAGNADQLAQAIAVLAGDTDMRVRLASHAAMRVERFEYTHVGKERAQLLIEAAKALPSDHL